MTRIVDLSQEIFHKAPVLPPFPAVQVFPFITHDEVDGLPDTGSRSAICNTLILNDHCSTHVDAFSHFHYAPEGRDETIEKMPLELFYTSGLCLNLSHFKGGSLIRVDDIEAALAADQLEIRPNDTVLLHTGHYERCFGTDEFMTNWPGIEAAVVRFLSERGVGAFGVESPAPGIMEVSNAEVHRLCGELKITHYENLANLGQLLGQGRFRFVAFPLKIRGGAGSPVRAVAVFDEEPID